jgi:hypothetical protein
MSANNNFAYTDKVHLTEASGPGKTTREETLDDLRTKLLTPPTSWQEVRQDVNVDLTAAAAKFVNAFTIPAGAIIKYVCMHVLTSVVAGGTTVKLALNAHGSTGTGDYVQLATLTKNTKKSALVADATPLAAPLAFDVNGVVTNFSALGDTNLSAGLVRVIAVYNIPDTPADV